MRRWCGGHMDTTEGRKMCFSYWDESHGTVRWTWRLVWSPHSKKDLGSIPSLHNVWSMKRHSCFKYLLMCKTATTSNHPTWTSCGSFLCHCCWCHPVTLEPAWLNSEASTLSGVHALRKEMRTKVTPRDLELVVLLTPVLFQPLVWGWLVLFTLLSLLSAASTPAAAAYIFFIRRSLPAREVPGRNLVLFDVVPFREINRLALRLTTLPDRTQIARSPSAGTSNQHSLCFCLFFPTLCVFPCLTFVCRSLRFSPSSVFASLVFLLVLFTCPLIPQTTCCCWLWVLW